MTSTLFDLDLGPSKQKACGHLTLRVLPAGQDSRLVPEISVAKQSTWFAFGLWNPCPRRTTEASEAGPGRGQASGLGPRGPPPGAGAPMTGSTDAL